MAQLEKAVPSIRDASRRMVRELGFMKPTLAGTDLPPSAVHALIEIGGEGGLTASDLCERLGLEKSSVSRMLRKLIDNGALAEAGGDGDGRVKRLTLTAQGRGTLAAIDAFASDRVAGALACLPPGGPAMVREGLRLYADALRIRRTGQPGPDIPAPPVRIEEGYRPGLIGRMVEMQARFYADAHGFGPLFESRVAAGLAEFAPRLDRPGNAVWAALDGERIVGGIAIDGEDLAAEAPGQGSCPPHSSPPGGIAHLRWFIIEDGRRGGGLGRRLLDGALAFADRAGFAETRLWTFSGLDAARRLYEAAGFVLTDERPGDQWGSRVLEQCFTRRRPKEASCTFSCRKVP
ncbi:MarR family winged helix-turn-helix transcriptional regulator [Azospirillum sp. B510]|uniref:MarR family winged helix-turn-helix transcriptional regulator n=1 Tax=Azospirillum sp. (strain B510) TaxID=137722 RepID=UPI0005A6CE5E|nr:MarR family winged helix-turn-helix transcriptional regulator [Azospirillum sp. B510]